MHEPKPEVMEALVSAWLSSQCLFAAILQRQTWIVPSFPTVSGKMLVVKAHQGSNQSMFNSPGKHFSSQQLPVLLSSRIIQLLLRTIKEV